MPAVSELDTAGVSTWTALWESERVSQASSQLWDLRKRSPPAQQPTLPTIKA